MSVGSKVISLYFIITYLFPALANIFFSNQLKSIFKIYPLNLYGIIIISSTFGLYFILSNVNFNIKRFEIFKFFRFFIEYYVKYRIYWAIFFLFYSIIYFLLGFPPYRYGHQQVSEMGSPILFIGILINTYITIEFIYLIFLNIKNDHYSVRYKIENFILAMSVLLFSEGFSSAFFSFIFFIYSIAPKIFEKAIIVDIKTSFFSYVNRMLIIIAFLLIGFGWAWNYGEAVKSASYSKNYKDIIASLSGSLKGKPFKDSFSNNFPALKDTLFTEEVHHNLSNLETYSNSKTKNEIYSRPRENDNFLYNKLFFYFKEYMFYLIERSSIHYYSLTYTIIENESLPSFPVLFPLKNLLFRLDYLFLRGSLGFTRPEVTSISRLNYNLLSTIEISNKCGTSPGLIASFNYVFKSPFNIIFCALYLCIVSLIKYKQDW